MQAAIVKNNLQLALCLLQQPVVHVMSALSACGARGVCLIPLLCFGQGSEQFSITYVCITSLTYLP